MKTKLLRAVLGLMLIWPVAARAQEKPNPTDAFHQFMQTEREIALRMNLREEEMMEYLTAKRNWWHEQQSATVNEGNKPVYPNPAPTLSNGCTNIDFENGTLQGWITSNGFHPGFNNQGCCNLPGGQQVIVTGNGLDPYGNFPVVAPGGNFSLRLGDNQVGGRADRIQQTFLVSAANAFFTYRYAVVLQDPGHVPAQQPAFVIEMFDQNNNPIPCSYYAVQAGPNIPGFQNGANGVVYKPWSNVSIDLTPYIGQNVTIRFTTYDCSLGGHFGYAYLDGICDAFMTIQNDTICPGTSKTLCAPNGFMQYVWNGPGVNNFNGQCLLALNPGNYTVQTTMFTGCPGPSFVFPILSYPSPQVAFTSGSNPCSLQQSFVNQSQISLGNIVSYTWNFGNNVTSNNAQPSFTFNAPGSYVVQLSATSDKGCISTQTQLINILPPPNIQIQHSTLCENHTAILNANVNGGVPPYQFQWNIQNSLYNTPSVNHYFTNSGQVPVSVNILASNGCSASVHSTLIINPLPQLQFNANAVCEGFFTQFQNQSQISSGSILQFNWNFNGFGTSSNINPNFQFPSYGIFTVNLSALSQAGCTAAISQTVQVYPNPSASFLLPTSVCSGSLLNLINTSSVPYGSIVNSIWNINNQTNVNAFNASISFTQSGVYPIQLTVFSQHMCASSVTKTLQVYATPQLNVQVTNACDGQMVGLQNLSYINGGQIQNWYWDFNSDGIIDNNNYQPLGYFYPSPGNYSITLSAISTEGCKSEKTFFARVYALPKADFTAKSVCLGKTTQFINLSSSQDGGITSWHWEFYGNGQLSNIFPNPSHTYTQAGTYLVKLEVQSQYGCINTVSKPVRVFPNPVPTFTLDKNKACEILCTKFSNLSTIESGNIVAYIWHFGDGSIPSALTHPQHCYKPGKYDITLQAISDSGCVATYTLKNAVEVYPTPVADFRIMPDEMDEMQPEIEVYNQAVGADGVLYYVSDGHQTSAENFNHTFKNLKDNEIPTITQIATNYHGCKDTIIKPVKIKPSFAIYFPNTFTPNGDGINDEFTGKGYNILEFELRIYDRWGKLLFKTNDINQAWDGRTKGSEEPIKSDVYVWKAWVKDIFHRTKEYVGHVTLLK